MKKVLIISSSPRKGNSEELCNEFYRGAKEVGNNTEIIRLSDYTINYCKGCDYCSTNNKPCVQKDDAKMIIDKMIESDVIVLATPVYFYSMSAQLKTLIDRCCSEYTKIKNKDFYYIVTAADTEEDAMEKTIEGIRGFTIDCLPGTREKGIVYGLGVWHKDEIFGNKALAKAYNMGKNI